MAALTKKRRERIEPLEFKMKWVSYMTRGGFTRKAREEETRTVHRVCVCVDVCGNLRIETFRKWCAEMLVEDLVNVDCAS